jgi:hypothetical protein
MAKGEGNVFGQSVLERRGTWMLIAAVILVALSIVLSGSAAKAFNGLAGMTWFAAAAMLGIAAWRLRSGRTLWAAAIILTAMVAFVVKPSDFVPAIAGFGLAGLAIALVTGRQDRYLWAKLIVGLYLPFHIGTAVLRAVYRSMTGSEASIRSEPPPTAELVPIAMLLSAVAGAWLAGALQGRRQGRDLART